MSKPTYNSGENKDVKKAKGLSKILREKERNGLLKICHDDDCRYVLGQFLELAGVFRDNFVVEPRQDAHNAGFRSAGLWWLSRVLLHDKDIIGKLQSDDGSPVSKGEPDDDDEQHSDNDASG